MNVEIALSFLSVILNIFIVTGSSHQKRVAYEMDKIGTLGIRKFGTIIKVVEDIALTSCSEFCVDKTDCIAFNYNIVLRTCETLATVASVNGSEIKSENNLFVTNLTWTEELDGGRPCASKPCNGIQRCIDLEPSGHVCVINECNIPPVKEGMKLNDNIKIEIGATARYECQSYLNESYKFSPMITCRPDGLWTNVTFHCRCGEPPPIQRAQIVGTERRTGGTVQYTCNTAYYKPSGNPFSTCLTSGQWSSTNFQCLDGWKCSSAIICIGINLKYTWGNNWATPGCGTCWCCKKL